MVLDANLLMVRTGPANKVKQVKAHSQVAFNSWTFPPTYLQAD